MRPEAWPRCIFGWGDSCTTKLPSFSISVTEVCILGSVTYARLIIILFFRQVFLECTEVNATLLILLDLILPEICAFIISFSCTVWTKTRSLACSFADGVLADAILISLHPTLPPTNIRKERGRRKKYGH